MMVSDDELRSITEGTKLMCTENFYMGSGPIAFRKGEIYPVMYVSAQEKDCKLMYGFFSERTKTVSELHYMPQEDVMKHFSIHHEEEKDRQPLCPFFREPCLEKDCTAFSKKFIRGGLTGSGDFYADERVSYCNALNCVLPKVKEER